MQKKLTFGIGLITLLIIPFFQSSCKRQYTCQCDEYVNGVPSNSGGMTSGYKMKSTEAEHICRTYEHTHYPGYNDTIATTWECELMEN